MASMLPVPAEGGGGAKAGHHILPSRSPYQGGLDVVLLIEAKRTSASCSRPDELRRDEEYLVVELS